MYTPHAFEVTDRETILCAIEAWGFATLVSSGVHGLEASHLPLLLDREGNRLLGHMARANPQRDPLDGAAEALAIFHGPHAYVSPSWYARAPAVPTWNYGAVHVRGRPRALVEDGAVSALLDRMVERHESARTAPWRGELPDDFRRGMEKGIVAFEMPIERVEAKFKLGQNRSPEDQQGTLAGLEAEGDAGSAALAAFTRQQLDEGS
ncbi:MAG: FMN-binding negative transcriptional regulator [Deltaproteobacteria bacterium]|nr:FMN-binding negative transcriptional regulator [Deltaproteobacteria bacterium]MBW2446505.1 FMN-binding negative transcriptional regulator [Deltaproteobacteria bacterium]